MLIMMLTVLLQRSLMTGIMLEQSSRADHSSEHIAMKKDFAETASMRDCEMNLT